MSTFFSYFDYYQQYAERLSKDQAVTPWRELPEETPLHSEDLSALAPSDLAAEDTQALPDPTLNYDGESTTTEFGSVGGDGESFYFIDPDGGSLLI